MIRKIFKWADKHIYLVKIAAAIWVGMIIVLCLMPSSDLPKKIEIPFLDKIAHFIFYFVLCLFILLIFKIPKWTRHTSYVIILLLGFSLFIEIMQYLMPWDRSFSIADLIANLGGIIVGIVIFPKQL